MIFFIVLVVCLVSVKEHLGHAILRSCSHSTGESADGPASLLPLLLNVKQMDLTMLTTVESSF